MANSRRNSANPDQPEASALGSRNATLRFPLPNGSVFVREFTRGEFEALIRPIVDRTIAPLKQALADAQLKPADIEKCPRWRHHAHPAGRAWSGVFLTASRIRN